MTTARRGEFRIREDNPCRDVRAPDRGQLPPNCHLPRKRARSSRKQALLCGVDGTRTRDQNVNESLGNNLDRGSAGELESSRLETVHDHSRPVETVRGAEPTPTERGILDAIKLGLMDVAR